MTYPTAADDEALREAGAVAPSLRADVVPEIQT